MQAAHWMAVALLVLALVGSDAAADTAVDQTQVGQTLVREGERVRVRTRAGHQYELTVTSADVQGFVGRDAGGKRWRVPYGQIDRLERVGAPVRSVPEASASPDFWVSFGAGGTRSGKCSAV